MTIDLPQDEWEEVYHLATLGANEVGYDSDAISALAHALLEAGVPELSHGWHGEKLRLGDR